MEKTYIDVSGAFLGNGIAHLLFV